MVRHIRLELLQVFDFVLHVGLRFVLLVVEIALGGFEVVAAGTGVDVVGLIDGSGSFAGLGGARLGVGRGGGLGGIGGGTIGIGDVLLGLAVAALLAGFAGLGGIAGIWGGRRHGGPPGTRAGDIRKRDDQTACLWGPGEYNLTMFRLLALLQLTRAALAFTAIADAWTVLLLRAAGEPPPQHMWLIIVEMLVVGVASFGLYGFGMALNDLLDARRDRVFAPRRPIPSGRIQPRWAVVTALGLLMAALLAAGFLTLLNLWNVESLRLRDIVPYSLMFALATAGLIVFYDATSKYLGGLGLVTLGAIRAMHCLIAQPKSPLLFLSMILLTHVIVVSAAAYWLENKRPRLKRGDWVVVVAGVVVGNGLALMYMWARGSLVVENLRMLIGPAVACVVYGSWAAWLMFRQGMSRRQKGERLMLMGLFWLFVYDASMLISNGQYLAGVAITLLLVCAIGSFFGIRFLSRAMAVQKVGYRMERGVAAAP